MIPSISCTYRVSLLQKFIEKFFRFKEAVLPFLKNQTIFVLKIDLKNRLLQLIYKKIIIISFRFQYFLISKSSSILMIPLRCTHKRQWCHIWFLIILNFLQILTNLLICLTNHKIKDQNFLKQLIRSQKKILNFNFLGICDKFFVQIYRTCTTGMQKFWEYH